MADKFNKLLGKGMQPIAEWSSGSIFTSYANKGWRAKILLNRALSKRDKVKQGVGKTEDLANLHMAKEDHHSLAQMQNKWKAAQIVGKELGLSKEESIKALGKNHVMGKTKKAKTFKNEVIIMNASVSPIMYIVLQNRPQEIEIEPVSYWATVKSMGRNSPFQIYTGSEDTINLDLTWYSKDSHRQDVVNKCRLLESWTKSDGYKSSPPVLNILWGNSDLFEGVDFVLTSASYKFGQFQDSYRDSEGDVIDLKLYPNYATQKLVFKRVSSNNLMHEDIISMDSIKSTSGIKID